MFKLKFYAGNAFLSSLIGLVAWVVFLLIWGCCHSFHQLISILAHRTLSIFLWALFCMGVGVVIGTISLFFYFQVFLRLSQKPWVGFLTNFLAVGILNILGAIIMGARTYQVFINSMWFISLIVSEILSFFLTFLWYRRIMTYKQKLEAKKASLKN
jgi:Mn2+/Fe2+ NRAMP family transporter